MPRVDDFLAALRGKKYFATIDLMHGFYQIELPPNERDETVFVTPMKEYRYNRLPMGLVDSPFYFQYIINNMLGDMQLVICLGYFDDICVFGRSFDEFCENLDKVLRKLIEWGFKIKLTKTTIGARVFEFLGHLASGEGIRPSPRKIQLLMDLPNPRTMKELQSILGMFNYFARYIEGYAKLAEPLYRLVRKERTFHIDSRDHQRIDEIKRILAADCMLSHFDFQKETRIAVDASGYAVGGILMQSEIGKDDWRPIVYFDRKLQKYQINYSASEKECLAILIGIEANRHYLEGIEFTVVTDHHALCQLPNIKAKNSRLHRWSIALSAFRYKIIYTNGKNHPSDCLSRYPNEWKHRKAELSKPDYGEIFEMYLCPETSVDLFGETFYSIDQDADEKCCFSICLPLDEEDVDRLQDMQRNHPKYNRIIGILENESPRKHFKKLAKKFVLRGNLLYRMPTEKRPYHRLMIDEKTFRDVFTKEHGDALGGHYGFEKTYANISRKFDCPQLVEKVHLEVASCLKDAKAKTSTQKFEERCLKPIGRHPMDILELDAMGPLKKSSNQNEYILVLVDSLTRFRFAQAVKNQRASIVIAFLDNIFLKFRFPTLIQTDQGRNFLSDEVQQYLKKHNIKHSVATAYRPQSQGIVERSNLDIGNQIRAALVNENLRNWVQYVDNILFTLNSNINRTTGFSPFYLMFGFEPFKPSDSRYPIDRPDRSVNDDRKIVRDRIVTSQQSYVSAHPENKMTCAKLKPGAFVYIRKFSTLRAGKKLTQKFSGPWLILERHSSIVRVVNVRNLKVKTVNISHCKLYSGRLTTRFLEAIRKHLPEFIEDIDKSRAEFSEEIQKSDSDHDDFDRNEVTKSIIHSVKNRKRKPKKLIQTYLTDISWSSSTFSFLKLSVIEKELNLREKRETQRSEEEKFVPPLAKTVDKEKSLKSNTVSVHHCSDSFTGFGCVTFDSLDCDHLKLINLTAHLSFTANFVFNYLSQHLILLPSNSVNYFESSQKVTFSRSFCEDLTDLSHLFSPLSKLLGAFVLYFQPLVRSFFSYLRTSESGKLHSVRMCSTSDSTIDISSLLTEMSNIESEFSLLIKNYHCERHSQLDIVKSWPEITSFGFLYLINQILS